MEAVMCEGRGRNTLPLPYQFSKSAKHGELPADTGNQFTESDFEIKGAYTTSIQPGHIFLTLPAEYSIYKAFHGRVKVRV